MLPSKENFVLKCYHVYPNMAYQLKKGLKDIHVSRCQRNKRKAIVSEKCQNYFYDRVRTRASLYLMM